MDDEEGVLIHISENIYGPRRDARKKFNEGIKEVARTDIRP
uniref:Uncharacterized protein n=1 Tax=Candidatus Kentrum sp. TC TaxID=2126339 RepID=A0A450Z9Z0_9GAMM|nr:MAG: hypothetical protein BECKTC1821D_GA0114238_11125 [Candidatus Kentron sp. TC]VFK63035.1 MAG: hypothetical protein BECKTC1821F_GA0114240_10849 [Candidatus Kentron sp. TC]